MAVIIDVEKTMDVLEFKDILGRSGLGLRRPVHDLSLLQQMVSNANLFVTARDAGKLVGIARSLTDYAFCTYLSDLAVDTEYQKKGIGKALIDKTKQISEPAMLILLSAPAAVEYYPRIGMHHFEHCYILRDVKDMH